MGSVIERTAGIAGGEHQQQVIITAVFLLQRIEIVLHPVKIVIQVLMVIRANRSAIGITAVGTISVAARIAITIKDAIFVTFGATVGTVILDTAVQRRVGAADRQRCSCHGGIGEVNIDSPPEPECSHHILHEGGCIAGGTECV